MKALMIGVHMDDMEFGVGGIAALLVKAGVDVTVLTVKQYKHHIGGSEEANKQSIACTEALGAKKIIHEYSGTRYYKATEESIRKTEQVIRDINPDILFIMHPKDNHIEHRECAKTAREAIFAAAVDGICAHEIYTCEMGPMQNMCYFMPHIYIDISDAEKELRASLSVFDQEHANGEKLWQEKLRCARLRGHECQRDIAEVVRILKFPDNGDDFLLRKLLPNYFRWQGNKMYYPGEDEIFM